MDVTGEKYEWAAKPMTGCASYLPREVERKP